MFVPATNIAATLWATGVLKAEAEFSQPTPTLLISPITESLKGMTYLGFDSPPDAIIANFRLDEALMESERIGEFSFEGIQVGAMGNIAPFSVFPAVIAISPDSNIFSLLIPIEAPPPQFSPSVVVLYRTFLRRVLPVG
jgi:hypothetical protein